MYNIRTVGEIYLQNSVLINQGHLLHVWEDLDSISLRRKHGDLDGVQKKTAKSMLLSRASQNKQRREILDQDQPQGKFFSYACDLVI